MKEEMLRLLFSISIKGRVLRSWQEANQAGDRLLSEKEVLILELVDDFSTFSPVTESVLCKVLGTSASTASDMTRKLQNLEFIAKEHGSHGQTRGRPLSITSKGRGFLDLVRKSGAERVSYLFAEVSDEDLKRVSDVFNSIDRAATAAVKKTVFGEQLDMGTLKGSGIVSRGKRSDP